jgi:hypothetical protein
VDRDGSGAGDGTPAGYADAVIENTLALLATITTTSEVCGRWATI